MSQHRIRNVTHVDICESNPQHGYPHAGNPRIRRRVRRTAAVLAGILMLSVGTGGCGQPEPLMLGGTVEAEASDIVTEVAGRIADLSVREGQMVTKGAMVAQLDDTVQRLAVAQLQAVVAAKEARLAELQAGTRTEQVEQARQTAQAAKAQRDQVKAGSGTDAVTAAKAQYDAALAQLALAENGAADTTIDMAEADLTQSQAALAQGEAVLGKYQLKAPRDGMVTLVSIDPGEVVNQGAAIGTVSDLSELSVRLYIPQKHLAAISLGQKLSLKATAIREGTVEGEIDWISDVAEFTPRNTETTASKESIVFRFTVRVKGKDTGLKPGMSVEAVIPGAFEGQ